MVTSKSPEVQTGSDDVVSALGEAVGAALRCSREFTRKCLAKTADDVVTEIDEDTCIVDDRNPQYRDKMR